MRTTVRLIGFFVAAVAAAVPLPAVAQTLAPATQRPTQGLFDRAAQNDQHLDVSVLVFGAYDDNLITADTTTLFDSRMQRSGMFSGLTSEVAYSNKFRRGEFAASGDSKLRYYPTVNDILSVQHAFSVGGGVRFGQMHLTASQTIEERPFFVFVNVPRLFESGPADMPPPIADEVTVRRDARFSSSSVGLTQQFGERTSLTVNADLRQGTFIHESTGQTTRLLGGRFSRKASRDVSLVMGYSYQDGSYAQAQSPAHVVRLHNLDAGVDYSHAIGRTRRTTVGFTSGMAMVQDMTGATRRQLTGSGRLNREIGRTWHATAVYRRSFGFVDGFQQPLFSDAVAVNVGGTVSRRLELSFAGGYSTGEMGFNISASQVNNYTTSSRARVALSRHAMLLGEYFIYRYRFAQAGALPGGVPASVNRQGARIGLELWLPLIR